MSELPNHLEFRSVEGVVTPVGKDPREMSVKELNAVGHEKATLRKLIRQNCISCCGEMPSEVKNCTIVSCVFWPYRMNKNPFSERKGNPAALKALHAKQKASPPNQSEGDA